MAQYQLMVPTRALKKGGAKCNEHANNSGVHQKQL